MSIYIKDVRKALKGVGIPNTDNDYIPCENHIKALSTLIKSPGELHLYSKPYKGINNSCIISCIDGRLFGAENEGSWFFEWGFIVEKY